jgi:hypothetical protein
MLKVSCLIFLNEENPTTWLKIKTINADKLLKNKSLLTTEKEQLSPPCVGYVKEI